MKKFTASVLLFSVLALTACREEADDLCCGIHETDPLTGSWVLYETGYSPGAGYIIEEVPASSAQIIQFDGGEVVCSVKGMEAIKFYRILTDTVQHMPYLALYTDDPTKNNPHSTYSFETAGGTLKLHFRWCFEGCHMGFKRVQE